MSIVTDFNRAWLEILFFFFLLALLEKEIATRDMPIFAAPSRPTSTLQLASNIRLVAEQWSVKTQAQFCPILIPCRSIAVRKYRQYSVNLTYWRHNAVFTGSTQPCSQA